MGNVSGTAQESEGISYMGKMYPNILHTSKLAGWITATI